MSSTVFSEILNGLYENQVVPYLGPGALFDASNKLSGESLFLSKDFPCSQRGNPQKYRDKFKLLRKPQPSCSP